MNRNQSRLTFAAAHATIWTRLQAAGWAMNLKLRSPRATTRRGRVVVALHFKAQALYDGWTLGAAPQVKDARSTHLDVRELAAMDADSMLSEIGKIVECNLRDATGAAVSA